MDDTRCTASTWKAAPHAPYGPGGFNRCALPADHPGDHRDAWGHVFRTGRAGTVRVLRVEDPPVCA